MKRELPRPRNLGRSSLRPQTPSTQLPCAQALTLDIGAANEYATGYRFASCQRPDLLLLLAPFAVLLVLAQCSFPTSKSIRAFFLSSASSLKPASKPAATAPWRRTWRQAHARNARHHSLALLFAIPLGVARVTAKASATCNTSPAHSGCRTEHSNAGERQRDPLALTRLVDRADAMIENT
jgi:hypothetical protein